MWFTNDAGRVCLQIRYGSKILDLGKGKNAIEISSGEELINVIALVKNAVENGEMDAQLNAAAESVKERFKK